MRVCVRVWERDGMSGAQCGLTKCLTRDGEMRGKPAQDTGERGVMMAWSCTGTCTYVCLDATLLLWCSCRWIFLRIYLVYACILYINIPCNPRARLYKCVCRHVYGNGQRIIKDLNETTYKIYIWYGDLMPCTRFAYKISNAKTSNWKSNISFI